MTTFDLLMNGDLFTRPDTADPHTVYRKHGPREYGNALTGAPYGVRPPDPPIRCKVEPVKVYTWADGYGNWRAKVEGPDTTTFEVIEAPALALDAILAELRQREGTAFDPFAVDVVPNGVASRGGGRLGLHFAEVTA